MAQFPSPRPRTLQAAADDAQPRNGLQPPSSRAHAQPLRPRGASLPACLPACFAHVPCAQSVRDDIKTVKESPLVAPGTTVYGYVYDVETGLIRTVE